MAQEGWPFVGASLALAALGWLLQWPVLVWIGAVGAVAIALFFRNPHRAIPLLADVIVAPADGKVVAIESIDDPYFACGPMTRVSIFLSVFDVHINRMPFAGVVKAATYVPGKFLVAFAPKASTVNERNAIWVQGPDGQAAIVVQIAGLIARRIVSYLRPGDTVGRGMRYGLIRFGSRVDLYLPPTAHLQVKIGDRVRGGSSIIGAFGVNKPRSTV